MEFLGNVVPFVDEMPAVHNTRGEEVKPDPAGPTSIYFFKTGVEPHIGEVQYFKVMSGTVHEGDDLANADRGSKERMAQIFVCSGASRERLSNSRLATSVAQSNSKMCVPATHSMARTARTVSTSLNIPIPNTPVPSRLLTRPTPKDDGSPQPHAAGGPHLGGGAKQRAAPNIGAWPRRIPLAHTEMAFGEP